MNADVVTQFNAIRDIPLWGAFFVLLGILIRQVVPFRQQKLDHENVQIKQYADTCTQLRGEVRTALEKLRACEEECDRRITKLQNKINNEAMQRVQSEISLVRTLLQVVPAPELTTVLKALEARKILLVEIDDMIDQPEEK